MVNRAARDPQTAEVYNGLVAALREALPTPISADDLKHLVDSMRGHMWRLGWTEPWLFQDIVFPLSQNGLANINDACDIWIQELVKLLGPEPEHSSRLFERSREGRTAKIAAFLFACSDTGRQQASLNSLKKILKR